MSNPAFLATPKKPLFRRKVRRRLKIAGITAGIVLIVAFFGARPARNAILSWQARKHAERALALIDRQAWSEARNEATTAYQLRSTEPQAVRAVARLLSRVGQVAAIDFWNQLSQLTSLTSEDLEDKTRAALNASDLGLARATCDQLLAQKIRKNPTTVWLLAAETSFLQQDYLSAISFCKKTLAGAQVSRPDQLKAVATLDTAITQANTVASADDLKLVDQRFIALAAGDDQTSLDALSTLAERMLSTPPPSRSPIAVDDLIRRIANHPRATIKSKLLAADLEILQHSDRQAEIEQREIDQWKKSGKEDLGVLANWLSRYKEYQRALDVIPLERAAESRELFIQRIDTLAALDRWSEIQKLLESEMYPVEPVVRDVYLARSYLKQGQQMGADNNWQRAIEDAAGDVNKLTMVGGQAEQNGAKEVATTAYAAAVAVQPRSLPAQLGRLRSVRAAGDTRKTHAVAQEMLKIWPNDPDLQKDEAYFRLLLLPEASDTKLAELLSIEKLAQKLVIDEPTSLPRRTLLALTLLKENRPYTALAAYRQMTAPKAGVSPSTVAVHAAVLASSGQTELAKKEAARIPIERLLPEERELIKTL